MKGKFGKTSVSKYYETDCRLLNCAGTSFFWKGQRTKASKTNAYLQRTGFDRK